MLYLDLNSGEYTDPAKFDSVIDKNLRRWEERYDIAVVDDTHVQRFQTIIEKAHERTGRQVVVLVDEYDKPLVRNFNNDDEFEVYRKKLAAFYSSFKTCAEHIRLVFLTGVSRFSKLSIFPDLNNLNDITFADDFADICGITEKELYDNFKSGIASLAEEYDTGYDDICRQLKRNYDGYRFATKGSDIYNPWSVLNFTVQAEAETSDGRIDLLLKAQDYIYVIELKYDGTAREALDQINGKQYALQFRADLRKLIKIGVSFSSKTRRIEDRIIE